MSWIDKFFKTQFLQLKVTFQYLNDGKRDVIAKLKTTGFD